MNETPKEFLKKYESALATQDWQTIAPLVHGKACVTFSNGLFYIGKDEVQHAFEKNFALIQDEEYSISDTYWVNETKDYAVCLYTFHWSGLINGKSVSGSGRGTAIVVNEEGRWLLLSEHLGPRA